MKPYLSFVTAMALAASLVAQDASDEDIFAEGAFDQAVTTSQVSAEATKLSWLGGVSVQSDNSIIVPADHSIYGAQSLVAGKAFLKADKPDLGQLFISYAFNHTWATSTNDAGFRTGFSQAAPSLDTPKFQLSEFHLSFDANKVVFFRLGNQLVNWGSAFFWSPADFVNQRPADAQAAIDTRTGKPGLRVHVPFAVGNFFAFADLSQSLDASGLPQDLLEKGSAAARVDTTLLGFNVGVQGSYGKTAKPQAGATFSGRLLGIDLWGEYGATLPVNDFTYSWAASLGGEKTWEDWTLRGEYFENPDGHVDAELTFQLLKDFTPFRWGQRYAFASLSKAKLVGDAIDASVTGIGNLTDGSYTVTTSVSTHFAKTVPFSLSARYNGGPAKREFTLQNGTDAWTFSLKSVLEF
ncbi:MAG: hypothetical protein WCG80_07435 [Spirochaetales bacterium]